MPAESGLEPSYPRPCLAWAIVLFLLLIYTVSFIDRQILALLIGPIKSEFGATDEEFGLLTGLSFAIFYTLFGIPFARFADRGSRRGLIAFGVAFWSLATAACGLARSFTQLFLGRVGVGIGEATLTPAANSLIADLFPPARRGLAVSVYTLGIPLGSALAFLFGGAVIAFASASGDHVLPLVGEVKGWQFTFLIVGLPGLFLALVMMLLPEPARHGRAMGEDALSAGATLRFFFSRWRLYLVGFLGISVLSALGYGTIYFIGAFFGRIHGFTPAETGLAFGLILLFAGTGGIVTAGLLIDRLTARGREDAHFLVLIVSVLFGLPFAVAFPLMPGPGLAIALLSVAIYFNNWVWGTAYAGVAASAPNEIRGQATAVYLFVINLIGLGVGPWLFGFFTTRVFADEAAIDLAYVSVALIVAPISLACLIFARPAFARQIREVRKHESSSHGKNPLSGGERVR
ncbi:MAG: MFS transporter [Rhodothalassiaceae bacterium]